MADYAGKLLDAVSVVVDKKLEQLEYNKTIKATIIDDSKAAKGIYRVKVGSTNFDAYSDNKSYAVDDLVYISVLNNNTSNQKLIVGRAIADNEESYTSTKPFDSFINISNNLITEDVSASLIANHFSDLKQEVLLWSEGYYDNPLNGYTEIGLSAKFKTWLSSFNLASGNFGLRLDIHTRDKNEDIQIYNLYFSNKNMIGNPYNFASFYTQQIVFDISAISNIIYMELYFYQEGGSFIDIDGDLIPYQEEINSHLVVDLPNNLFVKDILLAFGFNKIELTPGEDYVKLYTGDTAHFAENEIKNIKLNWIHWIDDESNVIMNNDSNLLYEIRWYQYELNGGDENDEYLNQNWKLLENNTNKYEIGFITSARNQTEQIQVVIILDNLEAGTQILKSNILVFENIYQVSTPVLAENGLTLTCTDGTEGNYFIYGPGNTLLNPSNANITRTIKVDFKQGNNSKINIFNDSTVTYNIEWIYDKDNAMFEVIGNPQNTRILTYKIKDYYSSWQNSNTITCCVTTKENSYQISASIELFFGTAGTSGTDATLVLGFAENSILINNQKIPQNAIEVGTTNVQLKARLFDSANKIIQYSKYTIDWSLEDRDDITLTSMENGIVELSNESGFTINDRLVLIATVNDYGDYPLAAKFPIPISANLETYNELQGITQVIYSTLGYPIAYNIPYNLNSAPGVHDNQIPSLQWRIVYNNEEGMEQYIPAGMDITPPVGVGVISENNILQPYILYVKDAFNYSVQAIDSELGDILWNQPILTMQNAYPSATLNKWNGKDVIVNDDSSLTAPAIAAGRKNEDNTFSGIMIGDWKQTNTDESITSLTGVYGMSSGIISYAFKEDGTAFIGKAGDGQIKFDGNHGWITSGNFTEVKNEEDIVQYYTGDSFIDLKSEGISMSVGVNTIAEGIVVKFGNNFLINNNGNVMVRGTIYATRIEAKQEGIIANFVLNASWLYQIEETSSIFLGADGIFLGTDTSSLSGVTPTILKNNSLFYVTPDGNFKAVSGNIGGWQVQKNYLAKRFTNNNINTDFILYSSELIANRENTIVQFGPNFLVGSQGTVNLTNCLLLNTLQVEGSINGFHQIVYQTYSYTIKRNNYYKQCSGGASYNGWTPVAFMNVFSGNKYVRIVGYTMNPNNGNWTIYLSKYPYRSKVTATLSIALLYLKATGYTVTKLNPIGDGVVDYDDDVDSTASINSHNKIASSRGTGETFTNLVDNTTILMENGEESTDPVPGDASDTGEIFTGFVTGSTGMDIDIADYAKLDSPHLTGIPTAPDTDNGEVSSRIATVGYIETISSGLRIGWSNNLLNYAKINSPHFTGTPTAPDINNRNASSQIATENYVNNINTTLKDKINEIIREAHNAGLLGDVSEIN